MERRNLSAYERGIIVLKKKGYLAELAKERQGNRNDLSNIEITLSQGRTRTIISKDSNISEGTLNKIEKIQEKASDEMKEALSNQDMTINKAFFTIKKEENRIANEILKNTPTK